MSSERPVAGSRMDFELPEESKRVIREMLERMDRNCNGVIDSDELEECLMMMGFNPTHTDLTFLHKQFDENGDGKISIDEMMNNLSVINIHSVQGDDLMAAFQLFDKNKDGTIGQQELLAIFMADGPHKMSRDEAVQFTIELFSKYDKDYNKKFSYAEFVKMFTENAFHIPDTE